MGKNCPSVWVCIIDVLNVFTLFYTLKEDYPDWKGRLKAGSGVPPVEVTPTATPVPISRPFSIEPCMHLSLENANGFIFGIVFPIWESYNIDTT